MTSLPPFWAAAAFLSGRLDLSGCLAAGINPATASDADLRHHGVPESMLRGLRQTRLLASSMQALPLTHLTYPAQLQPVPFAPPVLFARGRTELLSKPAVAIVGARRCSLAGRRFAELLARAVVDAGGVVVSGLAWGIDDAAHRGAGSETVAVVGQGLGHPFSGTLARRATALLDAGGLILSEFPPTQRPTRWTFPQRNRVISGLARAVAVVEAGERSGSLITARCALEQGRELFVVPDHPSQVHARGGLSLLATGVAPLLSPEPLLEAAGLSGAQPPHPDSVLALLHDHPTAATLADRTGEPVRVWLRRLSRLELSGRVERLPGGRFGRVVTPAALGGPLAPT